jgi:hypothetical protein
MLNSRIGEQVIRTYIFSIKSLIVINEMAGVDSCLAEEPGFYGSEEPACRHLLRFQNFSRAVIRSTRVMTNWAR